MRPIWRVIVWSVLVVVLAGLSACDEASGPAGGEDGTVKLSNSSLGQILVDLQGMTLYGFVPDAAAGGQPTCAGQCAQTWPPLIAPVEFGVGEGLIRGDFTTVAHTDGASQVAFKGIPLYYFAEDVALGDAKGQGVGSAWYVIGPSGQFIGR